MPYFRFFVNLIRKCFAIGNPSSRIISVNLPRGTQGRYKLTVVDIIGDKVYEEEISNNKKINLTHLPAGIYSLMLKTEDEMYNKQLIINN